MLRTLLAVVLICAAGSALSHSWYPPECCSGQDCYEIEASEVRRLSSGDYLLIKTGEVFAHPNSKDETRRKARYSPHGTYDRCSVQGDRNAPVSICLFVPKAAEG